MKKLALYFCIGFLISSVAGFANANLLQNGDFETVDDRIGTWNHVALDGLGDSGSSSWDVYDSLPGGWQTVSGDGIEIQKNTVVAAHSGARYVELDSHPGPNSNTFMKQFFNVINPMTYYLSFWYRPRTNTENDNGIEVSLGDNLTNEIAKVDGVTSSMDAWTYYSYSFGYLDAGSYWVGFKAIGIENTLGGFIDDVAVTAAPVPEPATMTLLAIGLAGFAGVRKRINKKL